MNERIKKLRKALDLTQQEFADRLNIKRGTMANYEIGRNAPIDAVISLICREFNVSEIWLRTGEGEMFITSPNGALDELAQKYGLSSRSKIIVERFLSLRPDIQEAVADYIEEVAAALVADDSPPVPPGYSRAEMEAEARAEAEEYYREILEEKKTGGRIRSFTRRYRQRRKTGLKD